MPSFNQGDLVFANFPFEEDKNFSKPRPCLVLAVDDKNQKLLAAKITTTELYRSWAIHIRAGRIDLKSGVLRSESWINLNRREWILYSDCAFKIGAINDELLDKIITKINDN